MRFNVGGESMSKYDWHRWFAWHPVRFPDYRTTYINGSRDYIWLQMCERRRVVDDRYGGSFWEYRHAGN